VRMALEARPDCAWPGRVEDPQREVMVRPTNCVRTHAPGSATWREPQYRTERAGRDSGARTRLLWGC